MQRVDIGGCFNITFEGTYKLITTHPNISNFLGLDISGTRFTDEYAVFTLLRLPGFLVSHTSLAHRAVVEVAKRCPKLLELGVGYSEVRACVCLEVAASTARIVGARVDACAAACQLSNDTFSLVCDSCRLLRHVRIHWCQQLGYDRALPCPPCCLTPRDLTMCLATVMPALAIWRTCWTWRL